jgi:hypothetical protein
MEWFNNLLRRKPEQDNLVLDDKKETETVIDMMKDDTDPNDVTIENAYKTRWIWYHTILAIEIFMTNILLVAILVAIIIKL